MKQIDSINTQVFFNEAINNLNIDSNRIQLLDTIAIYLTKELRLNNKTNLNFICTHNSRRSQLAQVWSSYAANFYKLNTINNFSGGVEITSFYRNTVKTLQEVGFNFQLIEFSHQNPIYNITYKNCLNRILGFSKLYDDENNLKPFIAITTCNNIDENYLYIPDAIKRFHLPFIDPKCFDSTLYQSEKYLEVNKQIAGEVHYIFKKVYNSL